MLAQWMLDSDATCFLILITFMSLGLVAICVATTYGESPWDKIRKELNDVEAKFNFRHGGHITNLCQRLCALEAKIDRLTETMGVNADDTEA